MLGIRHPVKSWQSFTNLNLGRLSKLYPEKDLDKCSQPNFDFVLI